MAKLLKREYSTALTTFRGTIGYLVPEWLSGQAVTFKVDVYSFGIVLFEIISGRRTSTKMRFGNHNQWRMQDERKGAETMEMLICVKI